MIFFFIRFWIRKCVTFKNSQIKSDQDRMQRFVVLNPIIIISTSTHRISRSLTPSETLRSKRTIDPIFKSRSTLALPKNIGNHLQDHSRNT